MKFIAKAEYLKTPGLKGRIAEGTLRDDRRDSRGARPTSGGCTGPGAQNTWSRAIFSAFTPRARAPAAGYLYRGHNGVAYLACMTGAPVVPVGLGGTQRLRPPGSNVIRPARFELHVGDPIHVPKTGPKHNGRMRKDLTNQVMDAIAELSGNAQDTYNQSPSAEGLRAWLIRRATSRLAMRSPPTRGLPFRDEHGRVIYVGKAKNLRNRVSSYFAPLHQLSPKTRAMVTTAAAVQWTVVGSRIRVPAAPIHVDRNSRRGSTSPTAMTRSLPYLAITMSEARSARDGHARGQARQPVLRPVFPGVGDPRDPGRPVARVPRAYLHQGLSSSGPSEPADRVCSPTSTSARPRCVGTISREDHRALAEDLCRFMSGHAKPYIRELGRQMQEASERMDFETAAARRR